MSTYRDVISMRLNCPCGHRYKLNNITVEKNDRTLMYKVIMECNYCKNVSLYITSDGNIYAVIFNILSKETV
jgi:hypothetical protein